MLESRDEFRNRVGRVDIGESLDFRSRGQVLRDFVIAVLLVLAVVTLTVWLAWPSVVDIAIVAVVFSVYCAIAFRVRVRPNHEEIGIGGGLIDHPLRYSDGVNRGLVNLAVTLALGRFISVGLVDGVRLLKTGKLPQERFMEALESRAPQRERRDR
jgi:hypothetical protein